MEKKADIAIYTTKDGKTRLDVTVQEETVWLSQVQMVQLFKTTKQNVSLHINNIFKEKELHKKSVVKDSLTTAADGKSYKTNYYNLDVIISVGYRIKSKRGTQFRIWATNTLKKYLLDGYVVNDRRLKKNEAKFRQLQKSISIIDGVLSRKQISGDEAKSLLKLLSDYNYALDVLDDYDNKTLKIEKTTIKEVFRIGYEEAKSVIEQMKKKFKGSDVFGIEKDNSFRSSIESIYQTLGGKDCYSSVEEKAANLLYFIVKNHSFVDGNKRIAASIFIWFLENNGVLYRKDGTKRIDDNALVAITLMIAESKPSEHKDIVTLVVMLINKKN